MALEKIADYLYVSKQLNERFAKQAAQIGIKTVICNRPDGEEEGQPSFETVKEWLHQYGIEHVVYMPMVMEHINDADLQHFHRGQIARAHFGVLPHRHALCDDVGVEPGQARRGSE